MQIPERPSDGDASDDGVPSYEWLDEWLCEYVDGTMDPSLEAVFEQYVEANPELKAHVKRLRETRALLRGCDGLDEPEIDPKNEVSKAVEEDLLKSPAPVREHSGVAVGIVSSIAVALVVGFLAGSVFVDPAAVSPTPSVSVLEQEVPAYESDRNEASPRAKRSASARWSRGSDVSLEETFAPQPASGPMPGPDTTANRSPFRTFGAR